MRRAIGAAVARPGGRALERLGQVRAADLDHQPAGAGAAASGPPASPRAARTTSTSRESMPSIGERAVRAAARAPRRRRRACRGSRARPAPVAAAIGTSRTVAPSTITQGALGADQRLGQVGAVLGQQVLQGVAGDLPGETAELGADHAEVRA